MAFVPEGVKTELPPWKAAWWRQTLFVVQLTVQHPVTDEYLHQTLRRIDRDVLHDQDPEGMKNVLRIWASEKAEILGLQNEVV